MSESGYRIQLAVEIPASSLPINVLSQVAGWSHWIRPVWRDWPSVKQQKLYRVAPTRWSSLSPSPKVRLSLLIQVDVIWTSKGPPSFKALFFVMSWGSDSYYLFLKKHNLYFVKSFNLQVNRIMHMQVFSRNIKYFLYLISYKCIFHFGEQELPCWKILRPLNWCVFCCCCLYRRQSSRRRSWRVGDGDDDAKNCS